MTDTPDRPASTDEPPVCNVCARPDYCRAHDECHYTKTRLANLPVPPKTTDGPEMKRLLARLFGDPRRKLLNLSITRGDGPATPEDIAREMNRAMDQVERGEARISTTFEDSREPVNVRDFLARLT